MSFSVLSNNLKYCRSRCWLPTEFIVNHMHLYCLSLGKQLSPKQTSYAQICINKPTHQAYFMRQKFPPKCRCGDQTSLHRDQKGCASLLWKARMSSLQSFSHHPSGWCSMVCIHTKSGFGSGLRVFSPATYKVPGMHLENGWRWRIKFIAPTKGVLEEDHHKSGGSQAVVAHHQPEQTPWNSLN